MLHVLKPRLVMTMLAALPIASGVAINPQAATAAVLGAWGGFIFIGLPLIIIAWLIGLRSLADTIRPLARLPILIGITVALMFISGAALPPSVTAIGAAASLWWLKFRARLF